MSRIGISAVLLFFAILVPGPSWAQEPMRSGEARARDYGTILWNAKWPATEIKVCWENASVADASLRNLVREAISGTWEHHSKLRFSGWDICDDAGAGIKIRVDDAHPHVKRVGRFVDQMPAGMVLNFTFDHWSPVCRTKLQFCIAAIAVHEFGHAIGFTHEQNRPDAPEECRVDSQGVDGDYFVTRYDAASIMNYCNPAWLGDGRLSVLDVEAVQVVYGRK